LVPKAPQESFEHIVIGASCAEKSIHLTANVIGETDSIPSRIRIRAAFVSQWMKQSQSGSAVA
jgi:hypothetical protein